MTLIKFVMGYVVFVFVSFALPSALLAANYVAHDDGKLFVKITNLPENGKKCDNRTRVSVSQDIGAEEPLLTKSLLTRIMKMFREQCEPSSVLHEASIYVKDYRTSPLRKYVKKLASGDLRETSGQPFLIVSFRLVDSPSNNGVFKNVRGPVPASDAEFNPRFGQYSRYEFDLTGSETVNDIRRYYERLPQLIKRAEGIALAEEEKKLALQVKKQKLFAAISSQAMATASESELLGLVNSSCRVWMQGVDMPTGTSANLMCGCFVTGIAASIPTVSELRKLATGFEIQKVLDFVHGRPQGAHSALRACSR